MSIPPPPVGSDSWLDLALTFVDDEEILGNARAELELLMLYQARLLAISETDDLQPALEFDLGCKLYSSQIPVVLDAVPPYRVIVYSDHKISFKILGNRIAVDVE